MPAGRIATLGRGDASRAGLRTTRHQEDWRSSSNETEMRCSEWDGVSHGVKGLWPYEMLIAQLLAVSSIDRLDGWRCRQSCLGMGDFKNDRHCEAFKCSWFRTIFSKGVHSRLIEYRTTGALQHAGLDH